MPKVSTGVARDDGVVLCHAQVSPLEFADAVRSHAQNQHLVDEDEEEEDDGSLWEQEEEQQKQQRGGGACARGARGGTGARGGRQCPQRQRRQVPAALAWRELRLLRGFPLGVLGYLPPDALPSLQVGRCDRRSERKKREQEDAGRHG